MRLYSSLRFLTILLVTGLSAHAYAIFVDGSGHYSIKPKSHVNQGFENRLINPEAAEADRRYEKERLYQAVDQSFQLNAEIRANDQTSFFARFSLFPDVISTHMGDRTQPEECYGPNGALSGEDCLNAHQDTSAPGYRQLTPQIVEAYGQHAFEYCLLQAGRRPRSWGLGIFLDAGHSPFSKQRSVYDGVTCDINIQKSQTLGFSVGYDKLAESGGSVTPNVPYEIVDGAASKSDDLDQIFFSVEFDDRKANAGSSFTRAVKIYFANIMSTSGKGENTHLKSSTDIKYADLFAGFYVYDLLIENEVLFRLGKSADPSWARFGGISSYREGENLQYVRNNVESIGFAGKIQYTLARSGASVGPDEYNQGNQTSHHLFLNYAYAPGDSDGYKSASAFDGQRSSRAKAMAFHKNFQPALILFNDTGSRSGDRIDGVFDPTRVMNATVISAGYKYQSQQNGNFELRLVNATMNTTMPADVKDSQANDLNVKVGYYGNSLGMELDLIYDRNIGKDLSLGVSGAYALPGDAWQTTKGRAPFSAYLLQAQAGWNF